MNERLSSKVDRDDPKMLSRTVAQSILSREGVMHPDQVKVLGAQNEYLKEDVTGVLTRKGLRLELKKRLDKEPVKEASFVAIDLKSLKWVNDTFTHKKGGDVFLKGVAEKLKEVFPDREDPPIIGRIGGDEFVIFVPHASDEEKEILAGYMSFLFDDSEDDNDGCWIPISDTVEIRARGRYEIEHISNGRLTMEVIAAAYELTDEKLTAAAEIEKDRGKPSPIRIREPR